MPRITVQVSEEQREEWDEFVEGSAAFESMSQLVRYSVEDTVDGWDEQDTPSLPMELREELSELRNVVDKIETRTAALETKAVTKGELGETIEAVFANQLTKSAYVDAVDEVDGDLLEGDDE